MTERRAPDDPLEKAPETQADTSLDCCAAITDFSPPSDSVCKLAHLERGHAPDVAAAPHARPVLAPLPDDVDEHMPTSKTSTPARREPPLADAPERVDTKDKKKKKKPPEIVRLRRLKARDFARLADHTRLGPDAREMARAVFVQGQRLFEVAKAKGVIRQRVQLAAEAIERVYEKFGAQDGALIEITVDVPDAVGQPFAQLATELAKVDAATRAAATEEVRRCLLKVLKGMGKH